MDGQSFVGGLGEHYCSQVCYDHGGAVITKHLLKKWTGVCSVCRGFVSLKIGGLASMVCWKPGEFLFFCESIECRKAVREIVQASTICVVCGTPIA